jgi:hypothetical protein
LPSPFLEANFALSAWFLQLSAGAIPMDDLLYFITKNPVAAIFVAWFLYRFFFGGKNKANKAQEQQHAQMKAGGTRKKSFQERLEEALKEAQSAAQPNARSGQPTLLETARAAVQQPARQAVPQPVVTSVTTGTSPQSASGTNDPFAFHSLMSQKQERADYDLNKEAFAFHNPLNETTEQEFHLKGFTGFHTAQGLSHESPIMSPQPQGTKAQESRVPDFLGVAGGLHRAIILNEILGRPRALRRIGQ